MFGNDDKVKIEARLAILDKAIRLADDEVRRQWEMWAALERPYDIPHDVKDPKKREARKLLVARAAPPSGPLPQRIISIANILEEFVLKK